MASIRLSPQAVSDFDSIIGYLSRRAGGRIADRYIDQILAALSRVAKFPDIGTKRDELGANTRVVIAHPYLIFYETRDAGQNVQVLRMLHGARLITEQLIRDGRQD